MVHRESIDVLNSKLISLIFSRSWYSCTLICMGILLTSCSETHLPAQQNLKGGIAPEVSLVSEQASGTKSDWINEMLTNVNSVRRDNGVQPIEICPTLMKAAQDYADLMLNTNHYDHRGPDGTTPSDRALAAGYDWRNPDIPNPSGLRYEGISENIAKGYQSVPLVMDGWINSPGHFRNLIDADILHVGFGLSKSEVSKSDTYWVQNFGFGGTCK